MESETLDWLSKKAPAFGDLLEREKIAIMDFALLWSFFESSCLGNNANIQKIRGYVQQLPEAVVNAHAVDKISTYFRARYTENDGYSYRFPHLHLERSKTPEEVKSMLFGRADFRAKLVGCLAILYRYRNNLFHGEKWEYAIQEQQENFEQATALLMWLMEPHT